MKSILLYLLAFTLVFTAKAQQTVYDIMERTDITITEAEQMANQIFQKSGIERGSGYKHFQRWLYERKFHTDENGYFISPQQEWSKYLESSHAMKGLSPLAGNWTELGPLTWNRTSSWNPGTGRLSALAIHPANEQIIYAGSPGGGIWKSINGGGTWQPLTDNLSPLMVIFALTIDPNNQNIVYAGTNGSAVYKSLNAGATWALTGVGPTGTIRKVLIHPSNSNIVFACASNGIFRSVNAGTSWTQVHNIFKEDIEFKPNDLNTMYATGNDVYRSHDNGITWTAVGSLQGITNTGRTLVAVTPANPEYVYIAQASGSSFGRMYKSTDAGLSFTTTVIGNATNGTNYFGYETSGTGTGGQATYDMALDVSPTNMAEVYIAGIICWKSVNEGVSFVPQTAWSLPNTIGYNHADVHGLFWVNSTLYSISDGGLFKSIDAGDNWIDLSAGMGIRQFYRFDNSQTNANVITGGAQDNGSVTRQASGNWADWLGADGMEGLVSPTNHLNIWGTSQNGSIYRSINGGNSYSGLPRPSAGQWVTPLEIHPTNETILYGGWTGVYKSVNSGSSWTNISGTTITSTLADLAVAPSNPNFIYASNGATLYVTTDDGATWAVRAAPATINDIFVDPTNPSKIWVALNSTSNRVMISTDAGATFTNISANLPALTARTIVTDDNTPRGIYVGMNIGVYYQQEGDATWTAYSDNLPLVAINELEIQKASGKIRVATYGRGIWESPVVTPIPPAGFTFNNPAPATSACPAPATMSITLGTTVSGTFTNPITLSATAGVPAGTTISFAPNPLTPGNSTVVTLNNANTLGAGTYVVTVSGSATGATTQTRNITFTITGGGSGPAITGQPASQTICPGANTTFNITAPGALNYQWQVSTDGGTTFTNITNGGSYSGSTTATLTISTVPATFNNYRYRCNASATCGLSTSTAATLLLTAAPVINTQPQNVTVCAGSNTTLCVTTTGTNLTYQWEMASTCTGVFTNVTGATTACYTVSNATTSAVYRCKVTNSCGATITSNCASLTVGGLVTITSQPVNREICSGSYTTFEVTGASPQGVLYQWQNSMDGGVTWANLPGGNTTSASVPNAQVSLNNMRLRCLLTTTACTTPVISNVALLSVRQLPTVTLTAAPLTNLLPGQTTTLTAALSTSGGGVLSTSWFKNSTVINNAGNTYPVNIERIGSYRVSAQEVFTSGLVCTSQSQDVVIDATASNKLFIFPSPNDGRFTVSYYNSGGSNTFRTITVYDAKGALVYTNKFPVSGPYTLLSVDIKPKQGGVYFVIVGDEAGKKLAQGKILVK